MFVCICRAVTDRQVQSAIEGGARTVAAVTQACCAGDDCGACREQIEDMLERHADRAADGRGPVRLPVVAERGRAA